MRDDISWPPLGAWKSSRGPSPWPRRFTAQAEVPIFECRAWTQGATLGSQNDHPSGGDNGPFDEFPHEHGEFSIKSLISSIPQHLPLVRWPRRPEAQLDALAHPGAWWFQIEATS